MPAIPPTREAAVVCECRWGETVVVKAGKKGNKSELGIEEPYLLKYRVYTFF